MFKRIRAKNGLIFIETDSIWMSDNDFGVYANNPEGYSEYLLSIYKNCSIKYSVTFRVYRTQRGMRAFIQNLLPCDIPFAGELMLEVGCDPKYIGLCQRNKTYHFRINSKGAQKKLEPVRGKAVYAESTKVCQFWQTVGTGPVHPTIKRIIAFHDRFTKAFSEGMLT